MRDRSHVTRFSLILALLVTAAGATLAAQPATLDHVKHFVRTSLDERAARETRKVQIPRSHGGEFALHAKINGVATPMVIDTGATSVVLTYETAKAAGLPLDLAAYDVDVETAGGHVRAARVTLKRLAVGKLVELSVPALVVPRGKLKTNLLGMSFLNRLESWEVRPDKLLLRGYP
jgi:aspartyl protease family protein